MCGIAGYIGRTPLDEARVHNALALMKNRGPDHQAHERFHLRESASGELHGVFLHSRLAIIDLDERSNQPFTVGPATIIFNGEIYNYLELRAELLKRGVSLRTESDTEVLLHYFLLYGEKCVDYFEGMWAFVIIDRRTGQVFFSRDRFSEKPLFYLHTADGLYFGSEVKFLKALYGKSIPVNQQQVLRYLVNGYRSIYKKEETFFSGVQELSYASSAFLNPDLSLAPKRYWQPNYKPSAMTRNQAVEGFREKFFESMKLRLRSDVPLAFCLSGGVDSSAIVSVAAKQFECNVHTFSILDSDERYNESANIQATVKDLGCKNTAIYVSRDQPFLERLKQLVSYHDSPIATISYYVHSFLSEAIAQNGYKVALAGTGADELVSGYYDHFLYQLYELRGNPHYDEYYQAWEKWVLPIVRNPLLRSPQRIFENPEERSHIFQNREEYLACLKVPFHEQFTEAHFTDSLFRNRMMNEMFHESIRVILHEDDCNSMLYSLENRSPYLDRKLFEFCFSIPPEHLIVDGYAKYPLRAAMKDILNDKVRLDRTKRGFNASVTTALNLKDKKTREGILDNSPIYDLVDRSKIEHFLDEEPLSDTHNKFVFSLLSAKAFLELN